MQRSFKKLILQDTKGKQTQGDPFTLLPSKNRKAAKQTVELHMGNLGIQRLIRFEQFQNLQVLWLNGNRLQKLVGLDCNFRLKHLYLQNNRIKTLKGSLQNLVYLQTLFLYNNELRDLNQILSILKTFTRINHIDMFDNPAAEQANYRLRVVFALPVLRIFDRHSITMLQKQKAKQYSNRVALK